MKESIIRDAINTGDPAMAEEAIREIDLQLQSLTNAKEKANLLLNKAVFSGILHRFEDARKQLDLALEQEPDDPDVWLSADFIGSSMYDQEERPSDAYSGLTTVLSTHAKRLAHPDFRFMYEDIQLRRGLDLTRMERFREAVPLLEESLSFALKPEPKADLLCSLGLCYIELREFELAKDRFLQASAIGLTKEWEGKAHFYLGIAYFYADSPVEAKREFKLCEEHATEYQLPILDVYEWLSSICRRLGETSESEHYMQLAKPI